MYLNKVQMKYFLKAKRDKTGDISLLLTFLQCIRKTQQIAIKMLAETFL